MPIWTEANQFQLIVLETCGTVGPESMCFLREIGRRLKPATGEHSSYLLQRLSVTILVGNLSSVLGTLPETDIH